MAHIDDVREAQLYFEGLGKSTGKTNHANFQNGGKMDGDAGPATIALVKEFQTQHGLKASGALDKNTMDAIRTAILNEAALKKAEAGTVKATTATATAMATPASVPATLTIQHGESKPEALKALIANSDPMGSKPMTDAQGTISLAHYEAHQKEEASHIDPKQTERANQQYEDALGIYAQNQTHDLPKFGPGSQFAVMQKALNALHDGFFNGKITINGVDDDSIARSRLSEFLGKDVSVNGHIDPSVVTPEVIAALGKGVERKLQKEYLNSVVDKTDHPLTDHETMAGLGVAGKLQWHSAHPEGPGTTPQVASLPTTGRDK